MLVHLSLGGEGRDFERQRPFISAPAEGCEYLFEIRSSPRLNQVAPSALAVAEAARVVLDVYVHDPLPERIVHERGAS